MRVLRHHRWFLCAGALLLFAAAAWAQESRGTISGRVTDSSGGVLPGVTATVVNLATNATSTVVTNAIGQYTVLYLNPGTYKVTVELTGFKTIVNEAVSVSVGDRVQVDFTLSPAGVAEEIMVVASSPILETSQATTGQKIESKLITEMPLGDGTAYGLTRLVPGATFERNYALQRPMDNDNLRGLTISGTINSDFTLDGSSNIVSQARVGIQPPVDAIQEFKVETAAYDAQVGHTGAGLVNLALKSGTNSFAGSGYYFNRDDSRTANTFASNRAGTAKDPRTYYRYGVTVSGPVFKNKTFFMFSYERLEDDRVEPFETTVPTEAWRRGDFSDLLAKGVTIYDPATARLVGGVVTRDAFPGNIIPTNRLNAVAQSILKYYPIPNDPPAADGSGNFFSKQPWLYNYKFYMGKVDHEFTSNQRLYARYIYNKRIEDRYNWAGVQNGVAISQGFDIRDNLNIAVGHTAVLSPSLIFDIKASYLDFGEGREPAEALDPTTLGFSAAVMRGYEAIPRFDIESGTAGTAGRVAILGGQRTDFNMGSSTPFWNISVTPTITKIWGSHTIKTGYDYRLLRQDSESLGYKGGNYAFDGQYTRASSAAASQFGQGLAAFVLGQMNNTSFFATNATYSVRVPSHSFFVHDDWRITPKLTLNIGLRYDLEMGMTETGNRNIRGFDLTTGSPIQAAAQAAYAANPIPQVPVSQFKVLGGYNYLSDSTPTVWDADTNNIQPRVGFAYAWNDKTVVRGGVGLYIAPFQISGVPGLSNPINQIGYSRNTLMPATADGGLTFQANLSSPLPGNAFLDPNGSSLGLSTNLGGSVGTVVPTARTNPEYWRYSFGVERELPGQMVVEISYLGQKGGQLPIVESLNYVPEAFRTTLPYRDAAAETLLSQTVTNPFRGLFPDNPAVNGATIGRSRLLQAYPHFSTLNMESYRGSNTYHGALFRTEKRFSHGYNVIASYTWSQLREKVAPLNPWQDLEERPGAVDRPHRIALASVAELPFGQGRRFGSSWNEAVDAVLGGWQVSGKYEIQSGSPITWGNVYWDTAACGAPSKLTASWTSTSAGVAGIDFPAWDRSCFYFHDAAVQTNGVDDPIKQRADQRIALGSANIRYFPTTLPDARYQWAHELSMGIMKTFELPKSVRMQIRVEAINLENYTIWATGTVDANPRNATFGFVNNPGQSTNVILPRDIQLGVKVTF